MNRDMAAPDLIDRHPRSSGANPNLRFPPRIRQVVRSILAICSDVIWTLCFDWGLRREQTVVLLFASGK